jgi:hypothetical protein
MMGDELAAAADAIYKRESPTVPAGPFVFVLIERDGA